jgi:murein DD-endopeptidase MepM/ murein hydrolase activator NlpD
MSRITCRRGLQVNQGDKIGEVGHTGDAEGSHCAISRSGSTA